MLDANRALCIYESKGNNYIQFFFIPDDDEYSLFTLLFKFLSLGECIAEPSRCQKGLSIGLRLFVVQDALDIQHAGYVFDSGGDEDREGVSIFIQNKKLHAKISAYGKVWNVCLFFLQNHVFL